MKVIAVDDEPNNLGIFEMETEGMESVELVGLFQNPREALEYVRKFPVDAAVLDVRMPEINGIVLGRKMKEICPGISLIFTTAYKQYAFDAFQVEASDYLLKPFNREDIQRAMLRAQKLSGIEVQPEKQEIYIRTFGSFDVFINGSPVEFSSRKAKELLALLVDRRGGIVTTEEMLTYLWEDKPDSTSSRNLCRKVVQRMQESLRRYGIEDIVVKHNRGRSVDATKFSCDYYQYLEGNPSKKIEFHGEYMTNYSWAEVTLGGLL